MEFSIDTKKVKKMSVDRGNGVIIEYGFNDGLITSTTLAEDVTEWRPDEQQTKMLSDSEMIERVRKSDYMKELDKARKKYKISKEIDDSFPEKDDSGNIKDPARKTSDESIGIIKDIIKKDMDGTLDEIVKHNFPKIQTNIEEEYSPEYDTRTYDLDKCNKSIGAIEDKIISIIRKNKGNISESNEKEFNEILEDYSEYCKKRDKLNNEIWNKKVKCG